MTRPLTPDELRQALCAQADPDMWFPDEASGNPRRAQSVCRTCPIAARCLAVALNIPGQVDGIWGGTTKNQRQQLRRTRRTAA